MAQGLSQARSDKHHGEIAGGSIQVDGESQAPQTHRQGYQQRGILTARSLQGSQLGLHLGRGDLARFHPGQQLENPGQLRQLDTASGNPAQAGFLLVPRDQGRDDAARGHAGLHRGSSQAGSQASDRLFDQRGVGSALEHDRSSLRAQPQSVCPLPMVHQGEALLRFGWVSFGEPGLIQIIAWRRSGPQDGIHAP